MSVSSTALLSTELVSHLLLVSAERTDEGDDIVCGVPAERSGDRAGSSVGFTVSEELSAPVTGVTALVIGSSYGPSEEAAVLRTDVGCAEVQCAGYGSAVQSKVGKRPVDRAEAVQSPKLAVKRTSASRNPPVSASFAEYTPVASPCSCCARDDGKVSKRIAAVSERAELVASGVGCIVGDNQPNATGEIVGVGCYPEMSAGIPAVPLD